MSDNKPLKTNTADPAAGNPPRTELDNPPPAAAKAALAAAKEETHDERNQRLRRDAQAEYEKDRDSGKLDTGYVIAHGRSVSSKIGIMEPGDAVAPKHFFNGQEDFDRLFELGLITKGKPKS